MRLINIVRNHYYRIKFDFFHYLICYHKPVLIKSVGFLQFIYTDKLDVDIAGALDLLQLSQKYKVHPLTRKCKELLKIEIPIEDSVKVFETARRYGLRELMDRAGRIMVK